MRCRPILPVHRFRHAASGCVQRVARRLVLRARCELILAGLVIGITLAAAGPAWAGSTDTTLVSSRPNAGGGPDVITVRFGLIDIVDINDRAQRFEIDAFVEIHWQDDRLASDSEVVPANRLFPIDEIWTPRLLVVNNRGLDLLLPEVATVDRAGHVVIRQRLSGALAADLVLKEFPFDTQRLGIDVVSYMYSPAELVYSDESELIANVETFSAKGWTFGIMEPEFAVYRLSEGGVGTSQLRFLVRADRNSGFYVLTLALPMTLILFLAWMAHWLPPEVTAPRLGMASATVFSLIAFGVSFRLTLPAIDYLTRADRFVVLSTLLVAASLAFTIATTRLASTDRAEDATRLARRMQRVFPIAYLAILGLTFVA